MPYVLQIKKWGGPEVLEWVEVPSVLAKRALGPTEVRIRVRACGVNFADLLMRMGLYPEAPKPPFVPGYEVSGTVEQHGEEVKGFQVGDRVLAVTRFGGYSTEVVVSQHQVRRIPAGLSDLEAAAIPVNFLTAWVALHEMARIREGDRVLIQSAAGGVGMAAVQMVHQAGGYAVGLVGSAQKKDFVYSLGAKEVFTGAEWEAFGEKTGDKKSKLLPFQCILDSTGGAALKRSFRELAPLGRIVSFGVSSLTSGSKRSLFKAVQLFVQTPWIMPLKLMMENHGIYGLNLLQLFQEGGDPGPLPVILDHLLKQFEAGQFQVKIGKVFPLEQGGAAQEYLQSRANVGKVVLSVS